MPKNNKEPVDSSRSRVDIWGPAAVGIVGLILLVVLAEQNPQPSAFQLKIYTSILALSAAAFAAIVGRLEESVVDITRLHRHCWLDGRLPVDVAAVPAVDLTLILR